MTVVRCSLTTARPSSSLSQVRRHAGTSGRHGHRHSSHLAVPGRAARPGAEGRGLLYERAL